LINNVGRLYSFNDGVGLHDVNQCVLFGTYSDESSKQETTKPEGESTPPASPTKAKSAVAKEHVTVMATVNSLSFADTILLQG
jgi:hypothetical protein